MLILFPGYTSYSTFRVIQLLALYYCFYDRQAGRHATGYSIGNEECEQNKNFSFVNLTDSSATKGIQSTAKVNQKNIKKKQ